MVVVIVRDLLRLAFATPVVAAGSHVLGLHPALLLAWTFSYSASMAPATTFAFRDVVVKSQPTLTGS